jgi:hypothetical protein
VTMFTGLLVMLFTWMLAGGRTVAGISTWAK